jgi:signal transduction histidine kinase
VRRRIALLVVLAAVLATALFGIPLAVAAAHFFIADEHTELERLADAAAVTAAADLLEHRRPVDLPATQPGTTLSLYGATGSRLSGPGPATAPGLVRQAGGDRAVHRGSRGRLLLVTVPVADNGTVVGIVRATTARSEAYPRIAETWAAMAVLAALAIAATGVVARRYTRRLTRPLEHLTRSAATLGEGDFSVRTQASGIPEIDAAGQALNRTAARIGRLVARERAFSADASHQLRTPLTGLRLGLETTLEVAAPEDRGGLEAAIGEADRLDATIDELLTLARDTAHGAEPLDLAGLLSELDRRWRGTLEATGRALATTTDPDLPAARASSAAVRQILAVLLDNAAEHGHGPVAVHARASGEALAIDVTDHGAGITAAEPELFRRRTAPSDGHGIGLALARSLAEAEGGRLTLTDRDPTTFTLFLPATSTHPDSAAAPGPSVTGRSPNCP